MKLPMWTGHMFAGIISPLTAFFIVLNVIFSDIFGTAARLQAIALVFGVYLVLGFLFTKFWPGHDKTWRWWLLTPPTIIVVLFSSTEFGLLVLYNLTVLAGAWLGALLGQNLKRRS